MNTHGIAVGVPLAPEKVAQVLNPEGREPYSGPTGTLRGVVRIEGDPPPDSGVKFKASCREAPAAYGKVFRVGLDKALADAVVAVTGYGDRGFVPEHKEAAKLTVHGCAPSKRTVVVTFGQRIEVSNLDSIESYMPFLDGVIARAVMVAFPGGDPVALYPDQPAAHYVIRDELPTGLLVDVFVVKYPTHDVTGLDGRYEIKDIPVGKVEVNAFLPVLAKKVAKQTIEIKPGDNTLDLTLSFDAKKDWTAGSSPAAQPSASGAPSAKKPAPK